MAAVSVYIDVGDAERALLTAAEMISAGVQKGLAAAGEIIVSEAKARCPVSTEKTRPGGPHGELRASINKRVEGDCCIAGTNVEYAPYVEFGTYKMAAQPYMVPALLDNIDEVTEAIKEAIL